MGGSYYRPKSGSRNKKSSNKKSSNRRNSSSGGVGTYKLNGKVVSYAEYKSKVYGDKSSSGSNSSSKTKAPESSQAAFNRISSRMYGSNYANMSKAKQQQIRGSYIVEQQRRAIVQGRSTKTVDQTVGTQYQLNKRDGSVVLKSRFGTPQKYSASQYKQIQARQKKAQQQTLTQTAKVQSLLNNHALSMYSNGYKNLNATQKANVRNAYIEDQQRRGVKQIATGKRTVTKDKDYVYVTDEAGNKLVYNRVDWEIYQDDKKKYDKSLEKYKEDVKAREWALLLGRKEAREMPKNYEDFQTLLLSQSAANLPQLQRDINRIADKIGQKNADVQALEKNLINKYFGSGETKFGSEAFVEQVKGYMTIGLVSGFVQMGHSAFGGAEMIGALVKSKFSSPAQSQQVNTILKRQWGAAPNFAKEMGKGIKESFNYKTPQGFANLLIIGVTLAYPTYSLSKSIIGAIKKLPKGQFKAFMRNLSRSPVKAFAKYVKKSSKIYQLAKAGKKLKSLARKSGKPTTAKKLIASYRKGASKVKVAGGQIKGRLTKVGTKGLVKRTTAKLKTVAQRTGTVPKSELIRLEQRIIKSFKNSQLSKFHKQAMKTFTKKAQYLKYKAEYMRLNGVVKLKVASRIAKSVSKKIAQSGVKITSAAKKVLIENVVTQQILQLNKLMKSFIKKAAESFAKIKNLTIDKISKVFKSIQNSITKKVNRIKLAIKNKYTWIAKGYKYEMRFVKGQGMKKFKVSRYSRSTRMAKQVKKAAKIGKKASFKRKVLKSKTNIKNIVSKPGRMTKAQLNKLSTAFKRLKIPQKLKSQYLKLKTAVAKRNFINKYLDKKLAETNRKINKILRKTHGVKETRRLMRRAGTSKQSVDKLMNKKLSDNIVTNPEKLDLYVRDFNMVIDRMVKSKGKNIMFTAQRVPIKLSSKVISRELQLKLSKLAKNSTNKAFKMATDQVDDFNRVIDRMIKTKGKNIMYKAAPIKRVLKQVNKETVKVMKEIKINTAKLLKQKAHFEKQIRSSLRKSVKSTTKPQMSKQLQQQLQRSSKLRLKQLRRSITKSAQSTNNLLNEKLLKRLFYEPLKSKIDDFNRVIDNINKGKVSFIARTPSKSAATSKFVKKSQLAFSKRSVSQFNSAIDELVKTKGKGIKILVAPTKQAFKKIINLSDDLQNALVKQARISRRQLAKQLKASNKAYFKSIRKEATRKIKTDQFLKSDPRVQRALVKAKLKEIKLSVGKMKQSTNNLLNEKMIDKIVLSPLRQKIKEFNKIIDSLAKGKGKVDYSYTPKPYKKPFTPKSSKRVPKTTNQKVITIRDILKKSKPRVKPTNSGVTINTGNQQQILLIKPEVLSKIAVKTAKKLSPTRVLQKAYGKAKTINLPMKPSLINKYSRVKLIRATPKVMKEVLTYDSLLRKIARVSIREASTIWSMQRFQTLNKLYNKLLFKGQVPAMKEFLAIKPVLVAVAVKTAVKLATDVKVVTATKTAVITAQAILQDQIIPEDITPTLATKLKIPYPILKRFRILFPPIKWKKNKKKTLEEFLKWLLAQKKQYRPSLAAILFNITAYKVPKKVTGFEIRPMIVRKKKVTKSKPVKRKTTRKRK